MSDLPKFSGRSCSNSSQPRPDECELSVDQIDDPSVSNAECLTTAEFKSWNDIFSNLSKGNDNGSSQKCRSLLSIEGDNLQFYPNFALFSTLGGMNFDHDFVQVRKFSEDQKKNAIEHYFEDQKKGLQQE